MSDTLKLPIAEQLANEILAARMEHLKRRIRPGEKRDYLYLSDIHTCVRHLYYSMAEGDKRKPMDEFVQARMESGEIWEPKIISQLMDMGFQIIEGQVRVEIKNRSGELIGRGKIDGKVRFKGKSIPCEIKNLDSNVFRRINSVEDLFDVEWTEKYVRQLLLYLYGQNEEEGIFLITDRGGLWRILPIYLGQHIDYVELTLQKMEKAFEAKKAGQVPDRITYHHKICGGCNFNAVCMPTSVIEGGLTLDDPELEAMLAKHEQLKAAGDEYKELHESVKELFKEKPPTTVGGRFIVIPKATKRTIYDTKLLTSEQRAQIKKETTSWSIDIDDVSKAAA